MSFVGGDFYRLAMVMLGLQFAYACAALFSRAALLEGMNPRVSVVYIQAMIALIVAPIAYFSRRQSGGFALGWRSFYLIFLASLIGVTANQMLFYEGLYYASSSMGSVTTNLVPAITFVLAVLVGFEKINIKSKRSIAKIIGTLLCVSGAICIALLKSMSLPIMDSGSGSENWLLGCVLLFAAAGCWAFWLILQVPVSASYPDHLSLAAWTGFFATIQSAIVTLFWERDPETWILQTNFEFAACFISAVTYACSFFIQAWCISKMGPLFFAMFSPLGTVITTVMAASFLHEQIYASSVTGAVGIIIGLYLVLWGKAGDIARSSEENSIEDATYMEEPLLA